MSLKDELLNNATLDKIRKNQQQLEQLELEYRNGVFETNKIESSVLRSTVKFNGQVKYNELTTEQKQSLLRILVKKILLNEDGSIRIEMN